LKQFTSTVLDDAIAVALALSQKIEPHGHGGLAPTVITTLGTDKLTQLPNQADPRRGSSHGKKKEE